MSQCVRVFNYVMVECYSLEFLNRSPIFAEMQFLDFSRVLSRTILLFISVSARQAQQPENGKKFAFSKDIQ